MAIPFSQRDGLGITIRIVTNMEHDLLAHVPHAFRTAQQEVLDAARAELKARSEAGDVVIRG